MPVRSAATPPFRPCWRLACFAHASSADMDWQDCACGLPAAPTPAPPTWIAREVRRQPCIAAVAPMSRGAGRSRRCRTAETAGKRLCGRRAARLMCVSGHPRRQHCVTALPAAGFEVATNGCQPMPGDAADYSTTRLLQSRWLAPRSSCQSDWADSDQTRRVISEPTRRMITDPTRQRIAAPTRTQAAIADHINGSAQKFWDDPTGTVISDRTLRRVITDLSSDPSR